MATAVVAAPVAVEAAAALAFVLVSSWTKEAAAADGTAQKTLGSQMFLGSLVAKAAVSAHLAVDLPRDPAGKVSCKQLASGHSSRSRVGAFKPQQGLTLAACLTTTFWAYTLLLALGLFKASGGPGMGTTTDFL